MLENVHKLKASRVAGNRVRSIDLTKKPLPHVKMPQLGHLHTVKTEAEFYRNESSKLSKIIF